MSETECDIEFLTEYERPSQENVDARKLAAEADIAKVKGDVAQYTVTEGDNDTIQDILSYSAEITAGTGDAVGLLVSGSSTSCTTNGFYDNSSIANAAVSFAYEKKDYAKNNGTEVYKKVAVAVRGEGVTYKACDTAVSAAVAWAGADDEVGTSATVGGIHDHLEECERWENMGLVQFDENGAPTNCEPGDILLVTAEDRGKDHGHVMIYVGNEIVRQYYPDSDGNAVAASLGSYSACVQYFGKNDDHVKYTVYRCIDPENSTTYADAAK
jgi:hypothetical protein